MKLRVLEDEQGPAIHWGKQLIGGLLEVFDRFAVDGLMTGEDVIQGLTELGTTSPRSHISRYLRARKMSGMQRKVSTGAATLPACDISSCG